MTNDRAQFLKLMAAFIVPAFIAGTVFQEKWAKGLEPYIAIAWGISFLLAIGYAIDGLKGAKDLLFGTAQAWAITGGAALFLGILVALSAGHNL